MRELNVMERIERKFCPMSKMDKRIARYFMDNYSSRGIILSTITEFAKQISTSEASVVRFCRTLGYSGYLELRKAWQEFLLQRNRRGLDQQATEAVAALEDSKNALREAIRTDIRLLRTMLYRASEEQFQRAIELICDAKCVYVLGLSVKAVLAKFLHFRLCRYGIDTRLIIHGGNGIFEELSALSDKDTLLIFDFHRVHDESLTALEFAKDRGAKIITITDGSIIGMASKVDALLMVEPGKVRYLNSLTAPMSLTHALSLGIAKHRKSCISTLKGFDETREKYSSLWRSTNDNFDKFL